MRHSICSISLIICLTQNPQKTQNYQSSIRWFTLALDSTDWALVSRCLPGGGVMLRSST